MTEGCRQAGPLVGGDIGHFMLVDTGSRDWLCGREGGGRKGGGGGGGVRDRS